MDEERAQPADHVKAHPLAEKVVLPIPLTDVKVIVEGVDSEGRVIRFRSAAQVDVHRPENFALVEVQPLDRVDMALQIARPAEHHIVLVGQLIPTDLDGTVYFLEHLQERSL